MWQAVLSWETLWWFMFILYVPCCAGLIAVVLLQKGKGVGFAGAFGLGPGSEAIFGPRAGKSLPVRLTYTAAVLFVVLALGLSLVEGKVGRGQAPAKAPETTTDLSALQERGIGTRTEGQSESEAAASGIPTPESPASPEQEPPGLVGETKTPEEGVPTPAPADAERSAAPGGINPPATAEGSGTAGTATPTAAESAPTPKPESGG